MLPYDHEVYKNLRLSLEDKSLGIWVDGGKNLSLNDEFIRWFAEDLKFDLLAIMIDPSDKPWNPFWTAKDIEWILKKTDPYAIEVVLTTWPYPDKSQIDKMAKTMDELMGIGPIAAWETDQEFNWTEELVNLNDFQYKDRDLALGAAGDYLTNVKNDLCSKHGCRNEITTFTYHKENSASATMTPRCDRILLQAYAVSERNGKSISFDGRLGPGNIQKLTLDRAIKIPSVATSNKLGIGHAAWNQFFESNVKLLKEIKYAYGMNIRDVSNKYNWYSVVREWAMIKSVRSCSLAHTFLPGLPIDHRWWSLKHISQGSAQAAFLEKLR